MDLVEGDTTGQPFFSDIGSSESVTSSQHCLISCNTMCGLSRDVSR